MPNNTRKSSVVTRRSTRSAAKHAEAVSEFSTVQNKFSADLKSLTVLDRDNFQADPHENYTWHKSIPRFEDGKRQVTPAVDKKKKRRREQLKQRFRKPFDEMLEEELLLTGGHSSKMTDANYLTAAAPSSKLPPVKLCSVCGYISPYVCPKCGAYFCSISCMEAHRDTRCQKWIQ